MVEGRPPSRWCPRRRRRPRATPDGSPTIRPTWRWSGSWALSASRSWWPSSSAPTPSRSRRPHRRLQRWRRPMWATSRPPVVGAAHHRTREMLRRHRPPKNRSGLPAVGEAAAVVPRRLRPPDRRPRRRGERSRSSSRTPASPCRSSSPAPVASRERWPLVVGWRASQMYRRKRARSASREALPRSTAVPAAARPSTVRRSEACPTVVETIGHHRVL